MINLQTENIIELIRNNGQNSEEAAKIINELMKQRDWDKIYQISEYFGQEISILIDTDEQCFIDWGNMSRVSLSPPVGSKLPFKIWLHTHPRNLAFWSETDQKSLFLAERILEQAAVLGIDGMLLSYNTNLLELKPSTDQSCWTSERVISWS